MVLLLFPGKYSSSKICEEAVNSIYDKVVNGLYASAVIPQLVKQGVLTSEDVDLILSQETKSEKTMRLLTILPRKGTDDYSYRVLFSALRNDNENLPHHNLGEELHEICQSEVFIASFLGHFFSNTKIHTNPQFFFPKLMTFDVGLFKV